MGGSLESSHFYSFFLPVFSTRVGFSPLENTSADHFVMNPELANELLAVFYNTDYPLSRSPLLSTLETKFHLNSASSAYIDFLGAIRHLFQAISQADPETKKSYVLLLRCLAEILMKCLKKDDLIPNELETLFHLIFDFFLNYREPNLFDMVDYHLYIFKEDVISSGNQKLIDLYNKIILTWLDQQDAEPDSLMEQSKYKIGSTNGMGGKVSLAHSCFVFFKFEREKSTDLKDHLFLRHLCIYILDHFFRHKEVYQHRHIPYPLGENKNGMYMEFVHGQEITTDFLQDWPETSHAFNEFGVNIHWDLYEGCWEDGVPHNVILHKFPGEHTDFSQKHSDWFRIDFGLNSVPFHTEPFIKSVSERQAELQTFLTATELKFLNMYVGILDGRDVDTTELSDTVFQLRKELAEACQREQVEAYRQHYLIEGI